MRLFVLEYHKIKSRFMVQICILLWLMLVSFLAVLFLFQTSVEANGVIIPSLSKESEEERAAAQKYAGVLTDEKAKQMLEENGFASRGAYGIWEGSFVSQFITQNMTKERDALEELKPGAKLHLMTVQESFPEAANKKEPVLFDYAKGWLVVLSGTKVLSVIGMIMLILITAPVFSEERECKTNVLIMTSCQGRGKSIYARITVLFVYAIFFFLAVLLPRLVTGGFVCGLDGWNATAVVLDKTAVYGSVGTCITGYFAVMLMGFLFTVSLTFCVSAFCRYTLEAAGIAAGIIMIPFVAAVLGNENHPFIQLLRFVNPQVWMTDWNRMGRVEWDALRCFFLAAASVVLIVAGTRRYDKCI